MTVFFQGPSYLLALCAWRQIRRARQILLFDPQGFLEERHCAPEHRFFTWWIRLIGGGVRPSRLPQETIISLWHQNNTESDPVVEEIFQTVRSAATLRLIQRLLPSAALERYVKIRLLPWVLSETLFYRTARSLLSDSRLVLIPSSVDRYRFHDHFLEDRQWRAAVPGGVRLAVRLRFLLAKWANALSGANLFRLILFSLEPLARLVVQGRVTLKASRRQVDVLIPLVNLFRNGPGKWMGHDMAFLLGGALSPARCAFYFADRRLSIAERNRQKAIMQEKGLRFIDPDDFKGDLPFFREAAWVCLRLWAGGISARVLAEDPRINSVSASAARDYLQELLFNRSVEFKAMVEFQDYSPVHVLRTVVANLFGRLTVGVHHANPAAPAVVPVTRYSHINRLCVWGRAFVRMHEPHWNGRRLVPIGAYRSDFIHAAQSSPFREKLQERYSAAFGGVRPLLVILFPTLGGHVLASRVEELLEGLRLLRSLEGRFLIVCRFRTPQLKELWFKRGLEEIFKSDARIIEDSRVFDSYQWMGLSDFVISSGHSAAAIEAAAAGKPCAVFDQMLSGELAFGSYGRDLILKTREDLLRTVRKVQSGQALFQDGLAALAEDFSYFSDGRCMERFRQAILDAAHDAESSPPATGFSFPARRVNQEPMPVVA